MRLIEVNVWSNGNNTARVDGFVTLLYKYNKVKFNTLTIRAALEIVPGSDVRCEIDW